MSDQPLSQFHEDMLAKYVECWNFPESRAELDVSAEEAAYSLFEHASHLGRMQGTDRYLNALRGLAPDERRRLGLAACRYIATMNLAEQARRILSHEAMETGQIDAVGSIVIRRDSLEAVLSLAVPVCGDLIRQDPDLSQALAEARCRAAEIDEPLLERPDVTVFAASAIDGLKGTIKSDIDWKSHWWFSAGKELDVDVEKEWELLTRVVGPPVVLARAAGYGQLADPLIDQLASQSPSELATDDHRKAWAHFLASAYEGTDPSEWLGTFLSLIESAGPLSDDWAKRKHKAKGLAQDRDWKRRYTGESAFQLDPRPLSSESDLLRWLNELLAPPSPPESGDP